MSTLTPVPTQAEITERGGRTSATWVAWLNQLFFYVKALGGTGPTAQRPTKMVYLGMGFFDTTLGKPIWLQSVGPPTVWVDATGAVV